MRPYCIWVRFNDCMHRKMLQPAGKSHTAATTRHVQGRHFAPASATAYCFGGGILHGRMGQYANVADECHWSIVHIGRPSLWGVELRCRSRLCIKVAMPVPHGMIPGWQHSSHSMHATDS